MKELMKTQKIKPCVTLNNILIGMTQEQRSVLLRNYLKRYSKHDFRCPAFGYVRVTSSGISETAHHASKRVASTILALNLKNIIENAYSIFCAYTPKDNRRQSKMKFTKIYELHVDLADVGTAKLMIGKNGKGYFVHYCCTAL